MKKYLKYIIAVILLISLIFFVANTDLDTIVDSVRKVGWDFIYIIIATGLSYLMAAIAWKYCFSEPNKLSISELFYLRLVGENVTIFNPTSIIGGEASKIYLLGKRGISPKEGLQSVVLSRGILIFTQVSLFVIVSAFYLWYAKRISMVMVFVILFGLFMAIFGLYSLASKIVEKGTNDSRFQNKYWLKFVDFLVQTFRSIKENKNVPTIMLFSSLHWIVGAVEFYLLFRFIGMSVDFFTTLFMDMGIVSFKSFGAFIPGQIGFEEYGNKIFLLAIGIVDNATWLYISVMRRAKQLFWLLFGFVLYFFIERNFQPKKGGNGTAVYKP